MVASPLAFASPHSGLLVMVGALGSLVRVECVLLDSNHINHVFIELMDITQIHVFFELCSFLRF